MNSATQKLILDYYANLLILQYRNKPKAIGHIKEIVKIATGDFMIYDLYKYFDVDTAIGAQLDLIGKIVGAQRTVVGIDLGYEYFSYEQNPNKGFSRGRTFNPFPFKNKRNSDKSVYTLSDSDFRILIKFKIITNTIRATIKDIDDAVYNTFGENIVVKNNKDMSMTYFITNKNVIAVQAGYKLGYLPAPMGVDIDLILDVPTPNLIFGFRRANVTYNGVGFSRAGSVKKGTFISGKNIVIKV